MNVTPLIARELRVLAGRRGTYLIRVLGVIILLAAAVELRRGAVLGSGAGGQLFSQVNVALFCAIWILVPLLSADCLSEERREGTLGLLFLTPLKARDIVLAKLLVHGLRGLTLWLALVPMVMLPFLIGGVSWQEGCFAVLFNFSAFSCALAMGLAASALAKVWGRALLLALVLSLTCAFSFVYVFGYALAGLLARYGVFGRGMQNVEYHRIDFIMEIGFFGATDFERTWPNILRMIRPAGQASLFRLGGGVAAVSVLVLGAGILLAAALVRRGWQDAPPAAWRMRWARVWCAPIFGARWLRTRQEARLSRNPIGWLEWRSWSGRLVAWGVLAVAVVMSAFTVGTADNAEDYREGQHWLAIILLGSLAASAAGSFQRERENGVMELLLVSPLTEAQIIRGRLCGIWAHFIPALALLAAIRVWVDLTHEPLAGFGNLLLFAVNFFTFPLIGLYFSLRWNNFLATFPITLVVGAAAPLGLRFVDSAFGLVSLSLATGGWQVDGSSLLAVLTLGIQLAMAWLFWRGLLRALVSRKFIFGRVAN